MSKIKTAKEILLSKPLTFHEDHYCEKCLYPRYSGEDCLECRRIARKDKETLAKWIEMIGGLKAWKEYTDERFIKTNYNRLAYEGAKRYDYRKGSILFTGPRGTGKSHLAAIIKRPIIVSGQRVATISMPDLLGKIKAGIKDGEILESAIRTAVCGPVLSLEDVGVEKPSEWVVSEVYYRIIDGRYKAAKTGMIITMNQNLDQLESLWSRFDPAGRVVSRLWEMCGKNIFSLQGECDYRRG